MYDDMQPDNNTMAHSAADEAANDREGAMAKADLYKLANYSLKLFKKLQDDDQLEGWVQAKITKAADYIASVYHYLEYEMKISEYGEQLNNAEMMSESRKELIKNKLMEAKAKVAELKKLQAEKLKKDKKEKKVDEAKSCNHTTEGTECPVHGMKECGMEEGFDDNAKVGDTFKTQHGTSTKTKTGLVHKRDAKPEDDEDYVPPKKPSKAAKTAAEKKADKEKEIKLPKPAKGTRVYGIKNGERFEKTVEESAKPDFLDMDKDGNKKEPMKKAVADKKKGDVKEEMKVGDKKKSSTGGTIEKTKTGVKHTAGKNYGGETAEKEEKKSKKVDEVAEWKAKAVSLRESLEAMVTKNEVSEDQAMEEMMAMAAEIDAEGLAEASKDPAKLDEFLQNMFAVQDGQLDEAVCDDCGKDPCECDHEEKKDESLNESTEIDRLKQFLTRLNG